MEHYYIFKLHYSLTLYMTGIIWLIQIIHYPLFKLVGEKSFIDYHRGHIRQTSLVIAIPMSLEILTAIYLLIRNEAYRTNFIFVVACALLALIWLITFFISVPKHNILARGFDNAVITALVKTNWMRTIAWSIRTILLFYLLR